MCVCVCNAWLRWKEMATWRSHLGHGNPHTLHTHYHMHIHTCQQHPPCWSVLEVERIVQGRKKSLSGISSVLNYNIGKQTQKCHGNAQLSPDRGWVRVRDHISMLKAQDQPIRAVNIWAGKWLIHTHTNTKHTLNTQWAPVPDDWDYMRLVHICFLLQA